jgi:hypothetical protein
MIVRKLSRQESKVIRLICYYSMVKKQGFKQNCKLKCCFKGSRSQPRGRDEKWQYGHPCLLLPTSHHHDWTPHRIWHQLQLATHFCHCWIKTLPFYKSAFLTSGEQNVSDMLHYPNLHFLHTSHNLLVLMFHGIRHNFLLKLLSTILSLILFVLIILYATCTWVGCFYTWATLLANSSIL